MKITNQQIYGEASAILRSLYGENARFRDGQYEAIEATLLNRRTLVVQRTGWGKSLVYFTCTKLLRDRDAGMTFVVSPLLVLMRNQIEAAERMGLHCEALNNQTKDRREEVLQSIIDGEIDLVFVTPETLFKSDVQAALSQMRIGLFVIDEAHCISDWGHDFRLEYSRLKEVLRVLPSNVPVLATTATANDRVVDDLKIQLGDDKTAPRDGLRLAALTTMHWLKTRLGDAAPAEWDSTPAPEEYLSATDEALPSLYVNQGHVINIVSLPEHLRAVSIQ